MSGGKFARRRKRKPLPLRFLALLLLNVALVVLAIVSKSTPLSTRYTATRVDVQVLASDDKSSAVSGIGSGEFVITTSTKPIEAGTQVRLAENG